MAVPKAQIDRRMTQFVATCRQNGMRVTHQRTEIFRELAGTEDHPDAEELYQQVYKRVPAISRDTVYRTLSTLAEHGVIRKAQVIFGRGRYDANTDPHHHFVCSQCGLVRDVCSKALDNLPVPRSVKSLGKVQSTHVRLQGICSACAGHED